MSRLTMKGVRTLSERVAETISRYSMVTAGNRIAVAVSGGPDSVLLLDVMLELRTQLQLEISVAHLNHLLRGAESHQDEDFVRRLCRRHDLEFHLLQEDVRTAGGNLEEDARNARLRFFRSLIESKRADRVATGHTLSDQAETVLFRLLRGAYLTGLSGVLPVTHEGLIRPLIGVERDEVIAELRRRELAWREDQSNADPRFSRNRIRHELLPWLEREWNPDLKYGLATLAELARDDERYWQSVVDADSRRIFRLDGNSILIAASELMSRPKALGRRLVRLAFELVRGDRRQIDFQHVEAALYLAGSEVGSGRMQAPGVDVMRSFDWMRFSPLLSAERHEARMFQSGLTVPSVVEIPGGGGQVEVEVFDSNSLKPDRTDDDTVVADLDWKAVLSAGSLDNLVIRTWQPGDEFVPAGSVEPVKLKQLFQDRRVPLWDRRSWPIITVMGEIVWAGGFGVCSRAKATSRSEKLLRVEWRKPGLQMVKQNDPNQ